MVNPALRKLVTAASIVFLISGQGAVVAKASDDGPVVLLQAHMEKKADGTEVGQTRGPAAFARSDSPKTGAQSSKTALKATITALGISSAPPLPPAELIERLVRTASQMQTQSVEIEKKGKKYHGPVRKAMAEVSNMAQFATAYKGFQASSEAADVILEEKLKLKSKSAVEWIAQKQHDELHSRVVESTMQIAQGLGVEDKFRRKKVIKAGSDQLEQLIGAEEAQHALAQLKAWSATVHDPALIARSEPMDVAHLQDHSERLVISALKTDPLDIIDILRFSHSRWGFHTGCDRRK